MRPVIKGKFIVFEGLDFCGKGTQIRLINDYLMSHPADDKLKLISVLSTRNPSNSIHTMQIRDVLQSESTVLKDLSGCVADIFLGTGSSDGQTNNTFFGGNFLMRSFRIKK